MEFIMGGIIQFGGNFAPRNWASCEGQLLAISQNQALYSILGTTWGGDGRTTFGLPDLRGRVPVGIGRGPGLSQINLGRQTGTETTQMTIAQMPTHSHTASFKGSGGSGSSLTAKATFQASTKNGESATPRAGDYLGRSMSGRADGFPYFTSDGSDLVDLKGVDVQLSGSTGGITGGTVTVNATGGGQKLTNIQPSLGMRHLICTQGTFPSRN